MQIEIVNVSTAFTKTAKGGYSTATVQYNNERGEAKSWKILSFSNPKVFDTMKAASPGQIYEVVTRKNDKDYTEWASADLVDGVAKPASQISKSPVVSQYETRDERNLRQRLIVRQSCLAQAIASLDNPSDTTVVLSLANEYVAWVFEAPSLFDNGETTTE